MKIFPEAKEKNGRCLKNIFPSLFLLLLLFAMPYRFIFCMDQYRDTMLFSHTLLAFFVLSFLLFMLQKKFEKFFLLFSGKEFAVPFVFLLILPLLFLPDFFSIGFEGVFFGYFYLFLPLFACINGHFFRENLPKIFSYTGGILLCVTFCGLLFFPRYYYHFLYGFPGNRNWNSSLLLTVLPFTFYSLFHFLKNKRHFSTTSSLLLLCPPAAAAIYILIHIASLGSFISMGAAAVFALLFLVNTSWRKKLFFFFCILAFFMLAVGFFTFPKILPKLYKAGSAGERVELIKSAGNTLLYHTPILSGNSFGRIEQLLTANRGKEYFKTLNVAVRSPHPHNHILYVMLGWGVPGGLLFWGILLLLYPVLKSFFLLAEEKGKGEEKLLFLALIMLLTHAQVDLIMEILPNGALALLLLGLCWERSYCRRRKEDVEKIFSSRFPVCCKYISYIFASLLLFSALLLTVRQIGTFYWKEKLFYAEDLPEKKRKEYSHFLASLHPFHAPLLYDLLCLSLRKNDPHTALYLADLIRKGPVPDYARIHFAKGQIFLMLGKGSDALEEYRLDAEKYPYAILPVFNMISIAENDHKKHLLPMLKKEFQTRIQALKITQEEFSLMLKDSHNELAPWRYSKENIFENWKKRFQK